MSANEVETQSADNGNTCVNNMKPKDISSTSCKGLHLINLIFLRFVTSLCDSVCFVFPMELSLD